MYTVEVHLVMGFVYDQLAFDEPHLKDADHRFFIYSSPGVECAVVRLYHDGGWNAELEYLRELDRQKRCTLGGDVIMQWFCRTFNRMPWVGTLLLEDVSKYTFAMAGASATVNLTRFRKFTEGQGWYEKYGFVGDDHENFHKSFRALRDAPASSVALFLWTLVRPCLAIRDGSVVADSETAQLLRVTLGSTEYDAHVMHHATIAGAALYDLMWETPISSELLAKCERMIRNMFIDARVFASVVSVLSRLGLADEVSSITENTAHHSEWLRRNVLETDSRSCNRTFLRSIYPRQSLALQRAMNLVTDKASVHEGLRDSMRPSHDSRHDVVQFMSDLDVVLEVFQEVGALVHDNWLQFCPVCTQRLVATKACADQPLSPSQARAKFERRVAKMRHHHAVNKSSIGNHIPVLDMQYLVRARFTTAALVRIECTPDEDRLDDDGAWWVRALRAHAHKFAQSDASSGQVVQDFVAKYGAMANEDRLMINFKDDRRLHGDAHVTIARAVMRANVGVGVHP